MKNKKLSNKVISILLVVIMVGASWSLPSFSQKVEASEIQPLLITPAIDSNPYKTLILAGNGTVWEMMKLKGDSVHKDYPVKEVYGITDVKKVFAPKYALKKDGTLWTWEDHYPKEVKGLANIKDISVESGFTVALDMDGHVWTWGENYHGTLGIGDNDKHEGIMQVTTLSDVTAIATGINHVLALKKDGTVWAWGSNYYGALGDGTNGDRDINFYSSNIPIQVPGITDAVGVGTGDYQSFAIRSDGTALAWGYNIYGQLGDGTNINRNSPGEVKNLSEITEIHGGRDHTIALLADGTVWGWGSNDGGMLGVPWEVRLSSYEPVQIPGLTGIMDLEVEFYTNRALTEDGKLWSWGSGSGGANGDGLTKPSYAPFQTPIDTSPSIKLVSQNGQETHVIFYDYTSTNTRGSISIKSNVYLERTSVNQDNITLLDSQGNKLTENYGVWLDDLEKTIKVYLEKLSPGDEFTLKIENLKDPAGFPQGEPFTTEIQVKIAESSNPYIEKYLSAGGFHTLGRIHSSFYEDTIYSWGDNTFGQLGDGTTINRPAPVAVKGLSKVTQFSGGGLHSLALAAGEVWAWGNNEIGQLGNGTYTNSSLPLKVPNLTEIVEISAGDSHNLALKADGTVWAWGANTSGQLGDGTLTHRDTPVQVKNLDKIIAISAGGEHSMAIRYDGILWVWGRNDLGQLGDGTQKSTSIPAQNPNLDNLREISAGGAHSMAVTRDSSIFTWGDNSLGQLGIGPEKAYSATPESLDFRARDIEAGYFSSLAMDLDESGYDLLSWGQDYLLSDFEDPYSDEVKYTPQKVKLDARGISAGGGHSIIYGDGGGELGVGLWGWGLNFSGQTGMGHNQHLGVPQYTKLSKLSNRSQANYFRLAGDNRIETAVITSQTNWSYGSPFVILARADDFPDALSGTPLAYALRAPILLTNSKNLSRETEEEIARLSPEMVIILGSEGAISKSIEDKLAESYGVTRIGGKDRFETAAEIASFLLDYGLYTSNKAVIAYGLDYPDALSVSSLAAYQNMPILLTRKDSLPSVTREILEELNVQETYVVGGESVVSSRVQDQLPKGKRLAGANRFDTAIAVARGLGADNHQIFIATGYNFPDALAASAYAAHTNSPILLVGKSFTPESLTYLRQHSRELNGVFAVGGTSVVSDDILVKIYDIISEEKDLD